MTSFLVKRIVFISEHVAKLSYDEMLRKKRKVVTKNDFEGLIDTRDELFFLEEKMIDKSWPEILNKEMFDKDASQAKEWSKKTELYCDIY